MNHFVLSATVSELRVQECRSVIVSEPEVGGTTGAGAGARIHPN